MTSQDDHDSKLARLFESTDEDIRYLIDFLKQIKEEHKTIRAIMSSHESRLEAIELKLGIEL